MTNYNIVVYLGISVISVITRTLIGMKTSSFQKNKEEDYRINAVISAKEIVDRFQISYQTVNHYTDFGLLQVAFKKGNVRFYNKNEVKVRLTKIAKLAGEGYSLRLIRRKLIGL